MPKLTFVLEDGQEIVVPLADRITVGSAEGNDVLVDDERVSPHHAELLLNADGTVQLFDLQSSSGCYVNGRRVPNHTLLHGDRIAFGPLEGVLDLEQVEGAPTSAAAPPVPPPSGKTTRFSTQARRTSLETPMSSEPPPPPGDLPPETLRAAENRLALLETAAAQAEKAHRDWLAAIERAQNTHTETSAANEALRVQISTQQDVLKRLADEITAAQARLEHTRELVRAEEDRLAETGKRTDEVAALLTRHQGEARAVQDECNAAREELNGVQEQIQKARAELATQQGRLAELPSRLAEISSAEQMLAALRKACDDSEQQRATHVSALSALEGERQKQEQAVATMEERLKAAQGALSAVQNEHSAEKHRLDETRALRASLEAANNAPLDDLRAKIDRARQNLGQLEARLLPLRDWKEAQDRRVAQHATLPADSPEARELLREIEIEAAELLRIIHTPPSRTPRITQVEPPWLRGVPMKSMHVRVTRPAQ